MVRDHFELVGTELDGQILIHDPAGEGGFSVVYRGYHRGFNEPVAVKCLKIPYPPGQAAYTQFVQKFRDEASLLLKLSKHTSAVPHAYNVSSVATAHHPFVPYIVLEWLDGKPLDALQEEACRSAHGPVRWPLEVALGLLGPAVSGLIVGQRMGIAHRDIKPQNFFVVRAEDGTPTTKILDFGIAKLFEVGETADVAHTHTGAAFNAFSPSYGAPEQFDRRKFGATGPWTDVFALALLVTELLCGVPALPTSSLSDAFMASVQPNTRPSPRARGLDLGDAIENVFQTALAVDPRRRFQRAEDFWEALCSATGIQPAGRVERQAVRDQIGPYLRGVARTVVDPLPPAGGVRYLSSPELARQSGDIPVGFGVGGTQPDAAGAGFRGPMVGGSTTAAVSDGSGRAGRTAPGARSGAWRVAALGAGGVAVVAGSAVALRLALTAAPPSPSAEDRAAPASISGPSAPASAAPSVPAPVVSVAPVAGDRQDSRCPAGMIYVAAGEFDMGSNEEYPRDLAAECGLDPTGAKDRVLGWRPAHRVKLSAYCIDRYEVTVARYRACVTAGKCTQPGGACKPDDCERTFGRAEKDEFPVNFVSFDQARHFCTSMIPGGNLPSEAQWEYAAKGDTSNVYPWGSGPAGRRLACGDVLPPPLGQAEQMLAAGFGEGSDCFPNVKPKAHGAWPVGSAAAGRSPVGAYDMAGNVMEWVLDSLDGGFYARSPRHDPVNATRGLDGVVRGGGWSNGGGDGNLLPSWNMRVYWREPMERKGQDAEIGFRCAASPKG